MTSIFKSYDALTLLSKNLEKLGTTQQTFTKAVIQTIGEMDSMMGKFLKETQTKTQETQKKVVEVESEEEGEHPVPKKRSLPDEFPEEEEEEEFPACEWCGKQNNLKPHTFNGRPDFCPFFEYEGEYKWLYLDLYLENNKWLIIAAPHLGPYVIGKKSFGSRKSDFEIPFMDASYGFWNWDAYNDSEDDGMPYRSIHSLSSAEMKGVKSELKNTYTLLENLEVL
jgi:hypothetical protein